MSTTFFELAWEG